MSTKYGFLFHVQVCKAVKGLADVSANEVTIPNIMDIMNNDISGKERENMYQRILMFLRGLEKEGICTRTGNGKETVYSIDFSKIQF